MQHRDTAATPDAANLVLVFNLRKIPPTDFGAWPTQRILTRSVIATPTQLIGRADQIAVECKGTC
jgi:hypothetical protein